MGSQSQIQLLYKDDICKIRLVYCWEGLFLAKKVSLQKCSYFQNLAGIEPFQLSTLGCFLPCSMSVTYSICRAFRDRGEVQILIRRNNLLSFSQENSRVEGRLSFLPQNAALVANSASWKWNWIATRTLCNNSKPRNYKQKCLHPWREKQKFVRVTI